MSLVKDLINVTAGLMGIMFEKFEGAADTTIEMVEVDDLTQIDGIGPTFANRLYEAGVNTFSQLAAMTPEEVRQITKVTVQGDPADWIAEAQSLA